MPKFSPYRDFWLRLSLSVSMAVFFVFLGTDSISNTVKGKYFFTDLLAGFLLTFISTSLINVITAYLDKQYPWSKFFYTRLVYQFIAAVAIPAIFILTYMYIYLIVLLGFEKDEVQFFHTEFPISVLFIIFWNVVYVGFFFFSESKKSGRELVTLKEQLFTLQNISTGFDAKGIQPEPDVKQSKEDETEFIENSSSTKIKILIAVSGNKNIPIPVENIAYFYKDGNYITLNTFQSETYLLNHTLDELMKFLEASMFFRANRQFIINLKACHYFTNEENGKLQLHLLPEYSDDVIISQKRAAAFKEWLNQ